jgi:RNA polymerase sigma-70 factor (ECF subfamily)
LIQQLSDKEHFKRFYEEHFVSVMRYCNSIVKDQTEASDIVQQAFIVLWQKRNEIYIHSSEKSYLYKMVYNSSLQFLEKRRTRSSSEQQVASSQMKVVVMNSAAEQELETMIYEAIRQLPTQCRRIFEMSRNENLKYREIAVQLDLSEKTVENQMGKALKILRIALKDYLPSLLFLIYLYYAQ